MNKRSVRTFSLGILFSAIMVTIGYYFLDIEKKNDAAEITGETVEITKSEWEELKSSLTETENELKKLRKNMEEKSLPKEEPIEEEPSAEKPHDEHGENTFLLVVKTGMNSKDIATILAKAKIVEDGKDFQNYLINNGYDTKIQVGRFTVHKGMTYEEISKLITTK